MICRQLLFLALATLLSITITASQAQRPGDQWTTTRGDATPGLRYQVATTTTSGRIIAVGSSGSLMTSDDGGTTWAFGEIEVDGVPVRGSFSTIYQVPGGSVVAVMRRLQETNTSLFKYTVRSFFVTSGDNGNTWSMAPFPKDFATFRRSGRKFYGVNIEGLHMGPGNELLAYGSISGTNNGVVLWNIGGLIFRQAGATWEQAHFAYGPIDKITDANGRAVATAHNAILDSADGAGWNGYPMYAAQVSLNGEPMDPKTQSRLRVIDVEVVGGNYIAQGGTFVPFRGDEQIDSNIFDKIFKLSSPTPFSGARNWNAFLQSRYHGPFTKVGNNIISAGGGGACLSSGETFTLTGPEVSTNGHTIAVSGNATAVAVQSSETVWKSTNSGAAWAKVWDQDMGPDLQLLGYVKSTLFARSNRELWTSRDSGESWQRSSDDYRGFRFAETGTGRLITTAGSGQVLISDDDGANWTPKEIEGYRGGFNILQSKTGRTIIALRGWDVRNEGKFFVSDDNGETWTDKNAGLAFGEEVRAITQTKSGRLIVATNTFASFNPAFHMSDDDGETWSKSTPLQTLEGLSHVTGDPSMKVIEIVKLRTSTTGRVLAMSDTTIVTSDDEGDTWNLSDNFDLNGQGSLDFLELRDIIQAGSRWIAVGSYRLPFPQRRSKHFLLVSDDDGSTWGLRPFETNQPNTFLTDLAVTDNGRVVITGTNSAVYVSEFEVPMPLNPTLTIREGKVETIRVDRPDIDGAIEARYNTVPRTAVIGTHFKAAGGTLNWAADDMSEKTVMIETLDNDNFDDGTTLVLQLLFETSDDLLGQTEIPISIMDNDQSQQAGLILGGTNHLYTSEAGGSAELDISLEAKPTSNVTVTVDGVDPTEGQISQESFVFTAENWGVPQTLTVTGIDDTDADGDAVYDLILTPTSDDTRYQDLSPFKAAVVNVGDEPLPNAGGGGFADWLLANNVPADQSGPLDDPNNDGITNLTAYALGLSPTGPAVSIPYAINANRTITFTVPDTVTGITFGSELSDGLGIWTPGPVPTAGVSSNGMTTYTLTLPDSSEAYARITFKR